MNDAVPELREYFAKHELDFQVSISKVYILSISFMGNGKILNYFLYFTTKILTSPNYSAITIKDNFYSHMSLKQAISKC